jgi:hypothetical protein
MVSTRKTKNIEKSDWKDEDGKFLRENLPEGFQGWSEMFSAKREFS